MSHELKIVFFCGVQGSIYMYISIHSKQLCCFPNCWILITSITSHYIPLLQNVNRETITDKSLLYLRQSAFCSIKTEEPQTQHTQSGAMSFPFNWLFPRCSEFNGSLHHKLLSWLRRHKGALENLFLANMSKPPSQKRKFCLQHIFPQKHADHT